MALSVTYEAGGGRLDVSLGPGEAGALSAMTGPATGQVEILFGAATLGEPERVPADALASAARGLLSALKDGSAGAGFLYRLAWTGSDGQRFTASRMQCHIRGVEHMLSAGRDTCTMRSLQRDASGVLVSKGEEIDIRREEFIDADHGRIILRRSTWLKSLQPLLKKLEHFAAGHAGRDIMKAIG